MKILVLNVGSSSIKFKVYLKDTLEAVSSGSVEEIGSKDSHIKYETHSQNDNSSIKKDTEIKDHAEGLKAMLSLLTEGHKSDKEGKSVDPIIKDHSEIFVVGHRVVHGGDEFLHGVLIDDSVIKKIEEVSQLAPLHNSANLNGIKIAMEHLQQVPQIAIFDTSFHSTLPPHAYMYPLPYWVYEKKKIRKYGFHGTSHHHISKEAAKLLGGNVEDFNLITLHLGNGSSACAIQNGKSIDTSMGLTPVDGLMMGTRCGDIDPASIFHISDNKSPEELEKIMNKESGLKGICGSSDMRDVMKMIEGEKGEEAKKKAELALDMFCYRIKKYIGSYLAILCKVDALIFAGGIGENSSVVRERSCEGLAPLGIQIDKEKNKSIKGNKACLISTDDSKMKIYVIPANEEIEIAKEAIQIVNQSSRKTH